MKPIAFSAPKSLTEALSLIGGPEVAILGGGTDLIIQHREGRRALSHMVDVKGIPELNVLEYDAGKGLTLGAAVSCEAFTDFAPAQQHYPGLVEGAELIGSTQIQSRATVGGNVCNGSPAADSICSLIALEAVCVVAGPGGQREIPAGEIMTGPGKTALQPGELLVAFRIPPRPERSSDAYQRFIPRNEMDIAVAGVGVAMTLAADGTVQAARVVIGAVAPTPLLVPAAGEALVGSKLEPAALDAAARASAEAARPITDARGTADYRRHLAGVLTRRVAQQAAQRCG